MSNYFQDYLKNFIKNYLKNFFIKKIDGKLAIFLILGLFLVAVLAIVLDYTNLTYEFYSLFPSFPISIPQIPPISIPQIPSLPSFPSKIKGIKKFASEEEFKLYLAEAAELGAEYEGGFGMGAGRIGTPLMVEEKAVTPTAPAAPERVSETTVQVAGIDEPDIVKTDGKEIYFSPGQNWPIWRGIIWEEQQKIMPPSPEVKTNIIKAFPPADVAIDAEIKGKNGDLLLSGNVLVIFSASTNEIYGYDISNPKSPTEKWKIKLEDNNQIAGARLYKNKIYLVTRSAIDESRPCPITPLMLGETPLTIKCIDIYHPVIPVPTDVTFTAMVLDPESGKVQKNISFVGSSGQSIVYMSESGIYITYTYYESIIKFFSNFLGEKCQDLAPQWLIEKMEKLESYDISQASKLTEFQLLWQKYINSLSSDERLKVENEFTNRITDYYKEFIRDLEKTGIVKIKLDGFELSATGNVPGYPLNQFALDEYNGYLRMATTIGERGIWGWGWSFGIGRETANDVYVLNKDLKITGSVKGMGLTEKIYSARFIEDRGYLVTFRQTDPFYVLDLSDPTKPELKGELKIPGYSSYLHPITKDKILGIGEEGWQVKISLFDVAQADKPTEKDKYILDEGWSEISSTHHAFLLDSKHQIFFLPGSKGGYVFSYKDDKLSLTKAVSGVSARRAIYINDYLYIIADSKITILNELDWEKVNELEF